jgi:Uma2 family endonuclease
MSAFAVQTLTVRGYLEAEARASIKNEFVAGHVYAMAGASPRHNRISLNIVGALGRQLSPGSPCAVYMADVKVRIRASDAFYYPDVLIVCGPNIGTDTYTENPQVIVEVMSPATEAIDRREKLLAYQKLPTLREYLLIAQDSAEVTLYSREAEDWYCETLADGEIRLPSLGLMLTLSEIYAGTG